MRRLLGLLLSLAGTVFIAGPARAHDGLPVVVTMEQRAADLYLVRLILPPSVPEFVRPAFAIEPGCRATRDTADLTQPTAEAVLLRCARGIGGARLVLRYPGGKPAVPTLARIVWQSGETRSVLAEPGATELTLPQPETAPGVLRDYLALGVQHILEGWDHLLFLLCLLLIARTPRRILLTVTGFTLGHAVTLTAVTLGVAGLPAPPVEAAIALSIMFLAAEIVKPHHGTLTWRHPVAISSAFGILHGFGFASALREIGLPQTELPLALLAFNLGIETGQLIFVLGCALALFLLQSATAQRSPGTIERAGSGVAWVAGCIAAYWFVDRSLGLF